MKQLSRLIIVVSASSALATGLLAGTESYSGKESKAAVAPAPVPPMCEWSGFYVGLNAGGEFGGGKKTVGRQSDESGAETAFEPGHWHEER